MSTIVAMVCVAIACAPAHAAATDTLYLTPGRMIDVGGYTLNLVCRGSGSPVVVFDAGLGDWSPAWSTVQPAIAMTTRACSYDRAGNGSSRSGPLPRTSARIVSELHALLGAAGESPPYVLVAHSFGSYNMRLFADRYLDEVAGIVLVDGSHEDQDALLTATIPHWEAQWRTMLTGLRRCAALAAARAGRWTGPTRAACANSFFRGLPERSFSARMNALLAAQTLAPNAYLATLDEAAAFRGASAGEVRRARRPFGDVPLRILTATRHFVDTPKTPAAQRRREAAFERGWQRLQHGWLGLSTNARQTLARSSDHYVQLDQPGLVIVAIREEIALARRGALAGVRTKSVTAARTRRGCASR